MLLFLLGLALQQPVRTDSLTGRDIAAIATAAIEQTLARSRVAHRTLPSPVRVDIVSANAALAMHAGHAPRAIERARWLPRTPHVESETFSVPSCQTNPQRISQRCEMREQGTLVRIQSVKPGDQRGTFTVRVDVIVANAAEISSRRITGDTGVVDVARGGAAGGPEARLRHLDVP